jgi:site-specific DNA-methyltransferase (adenine-specific)
MFEDKKYELFLGDALETMATLQDNSVDLILVDLPYGVTNNKWDIIIPFEEMWKQFNRIKNSNTAIILTATQPFSSMLVMSNLKQFKYDIIW